MSAPMKIAYDIKLMKPGCVLVQAAMGCEGNIALHFNTEDWLLAPTPNMHVYPVTEQQLAMLVAKTRAARDI